MEKLDELKNLIQNSSKFLMITTTMVDTIAEMKLEATTNLIQHVSQRISAKWQITLNSNSLDIEHENEQINGDMQPILDPVAALDYEMSY